MGYKSKIAFVFTASVLSMSSFAACFGYAGVGGPCYAGVGGPEYAGVGGAAYAGVGGPRYAGVGGPAYAGVGGDGSEKLPTTLCK